MKSSLALHVLALLSFLATLHIVGQATASATETVSAATTTAQSPSLRAPHRSALPTRVMSTQKRMSTITATTRQTRHPVARSSIAPAAHPTSSTSSTSTSTSLSSTKRVASDDSASKSKSNLNSARPLRSVGSSIANTANTVNSRNNGARQNRSLQSASSSSAITSNSVTTTVTRRSSSSNSLTATGSNQQKHERVDRRHHFRTNQYSSHESTTPKTQTSLPLAASMSTSSVVRHQPTVLETSSRRRSKESSMPLEDVDTTDDGGKLRKHDSQAHNNATLQRETAKTPRMIHRLVAGHIQNAEESSSYQVSAVSGNNTISKSTVKPKAKITLTQHRIATRPTKASAKYSSTATSTSTTVTPVKLQTFLPSVPDDEREDDEALLDDSGDFDNWDNGILRLSAGSGKEHSKSKKHSKIDDSKKTLSDQVRDGKYGLIEKEIFRRRPKRPGVLSYLPNKEFPIDNEHNYGGLQEDDIWLAEDHLLVIKGGSLNEERQHDEPWPPIDDYDAPGRQIKIPPNPKVPPPFPVQLEENGPVQFIGNNKFTVVYPVANESIPVYTAGPETNSAPSENDSDNEKNTITRSGTPQDVASGEPHYVYPAPYPSWLFNNQTFVNPLLSSARPITFPGLGPFPLGRNGSLDNVNGTNFLDEDDPTLYYPPAYSFVYKNNYTNAVPPGPLVPGIVLPPPANQFSRLEKHERTPTPTSTTISPRQRIPSTTTSTTTSTSTTTTKATTTTTTASEPQFRNAITKISEYTPKIINITPVTPTLSKAVPPTPKARIPSKPSTTPPSSPYSIEPIPVPVAIPIPVYPGRRYPPSRTNIVNFMPTTPEPTKDTLSKSNPIYYEYFEAKKQPIKANVIDDFLTSTVQPPHSPKPIKLYATSKRPFKPQQQRKFVQPLQQQRLPFRENVVYITPKPEARYQFPTQEPIYKPRPLENFDREVSALRETLRYYHNQQLRDNAIPRTPKVKPIYEFSFDASKNIQRPANTNNNEFRPPSEFDEEPFKPMVTYSPPINDENSFSPMPYDKLDIEAAQKLTAATKEEAEQPIYQPTTTLIPVPKDVEYQQVQQPQTGRLKKQRLSAKYLKEPFIETTYDQQSPEQPSVAQRPWVAVEKVPLDDYENRPEEQAQQYDQYRARLPVPRNRVYTGGYFYAPPPTPQHIRQNNRFYDEPFQQPVRKFINYRTRPNSHYQQSQQQQQQQQHQPHNYWSLENDTYVNFAPNRPPYNPDAEFIDPYQTVRVNPYAAQGKYPPPPPVSHQSQYYAPPTRQRIPLHRDILVNYRQPLPPINPDSEFISHPNVVRNQANQIYRSDSYRSHPSVLLNDNDDEQDNVYYASPKYRRANNNNNNNNNNDKNDVNKQGREGRNGNVNGNGNGSSDTNNGK